MRAGGFGGWGGVRPVMRRARRLGPTAAAMAVMRWWGVGDDDHLSPQAWRMGVMRIGEEHGRGTPPSAPR
jgi:hypothetical protein